LSGGRYGVAGDPVPDTWSNDSLISGSLILCFLLMIFGFSRISGLIGRQMKDYFYVQKGEHSVEATGDEINFQIIYTIITCFTCSLLYYVYVITAVDNTFVFSIEHMLLGVIFLVMAAYFLLKFLLYAIFIPVSIGYVSLVFLKKISYEAVFEFAWMSPKELSPITVF
jgi:uncharacterized Tic20 family protein